jgi:Zn-dependent protease
MGHHPHGGYEGRMRSAREWVVAAEHLGGPPSIERGRDAVALGRWVAARAILEPLAATHVEASHLLLIAALWIEDDDLVAPARSAIEAALPAEHPWRRNLAVVDATRALERNEIATARALVEPLLQIRDAEPELRASWLQFLSNLERRENRAADAVRMLRDAERTLTDAYGKEDPRVFPLLAERAEILLDHDAVEGQRVLERGRELARALRPEHHAALPLLLVELGWRRATGDEAKALLAEVLVLGEEALGASHPTMSWLRVWMVAERLHGDDLHGALSLANHELGSPGLRPAVRLELLRTRAAIHLRLGRTVQSRADLEDAEELSASSLRDQLPKVLGELALVTILADERDRAFGHLRHRLQLLETLHGTKAPPTLGTRNAILHLLAGTPDPAMVARSLDSDSKQEPERGWAASGWSALLFLGGFVVFLGWADAFALLAVVFLHEAGHFVAMRLFGYRDPRIYFVPFLGAVTTGGLPIEEQHAVRRAIVALAGPVPSLLLALLACFVLPVLPLEGETTIVQRTWLYAVGLNYLNLLPLAPLDGGKIVDTLVLHRWPWARVAFALLSGGVVVLVAVAANSPVMFVFGMFLVVVAATGVRRVRLDTVLQRALATLPGTERTRPTAQVGVLYEVLHPLEKRQGLSYIQRFRALTHALGESVLVPTGHGSRWALLGAYGALLLLSPLLLVLASVLARR